MQKHLAAEQSAGGGGGVDGPGGSKQQGLQPDNRPRQDAKAQVQRVVHYFYIYLQLALDKFKGTVIRDYNLLLLFIESSVNPEFRVFSSSFFLRQNKKYIQ